MKIKITIELSDKTVELTMEEAEELYKELSKLFGNNSSPPFKLPWEDPWPQEPLKITCYSE